VSAPPDSRALPFAPGPADSATGLSPSTPADGRSHTRRGNVGWVILVVIVAGALLAWTIFDRGSESPPAAVSVAAPPVAPSATEKPAPATADARQPQAELTTTRDVWVRVIADGARVLERQLPAGSRVPFTAQKTIVIRTGNAGAVRLSIHGKDHGALGLEGQVVTRTFSVPRPGSAGQ
jgi:hypothetical protein